MHQTFAVNNRSVNYNFIRNRRTSILSILRSIVSEEEWRVKWARRKKKFVSSGISRCAHGRRCIGNVMLILRGTACRTVGAFQESLASPAALTMIRPAARRWRRYRAPRIYRGDRPIYHIPIPPSLHGRFSSSLPRFALLCLASDFFTRGTEIPRFCYGGLTYLTPVCKCTSVNRLFILAPIYNLSA